MPRHKRAVALGYKNYETDAPIVLAKGERLTAEKIVEIAKAYSVPLYKDNALCGLLYRLDIGESIPERLFKAVAEVLAYIYSVEGRIS